MEETKKKKSNRAAIAITAGALAIGGAIALASLPKKEEKAATSTKEYRWVDTSEETQQETQRPAEYPKTVGRGNYYFSVNDAWEEHLVKSMLGIEHNYNNTYYPTGDDVDTYLSKLNVSGLDNWRKYWNGYFASLNRQDVVSWIETMYKKYFPKIYDVSGQIVDQTTGAGINGVSVNFIELGISILTDSNGNYYLTNVTQGTYTIEATKTGYISTQLTIKVPPSAIPDIQLQKIGETPGPTLYKINGKVINDETEMAIPGATVKILDTDFIASTALDGSFTINNIPAGNYLIDAEKAFYISTASYQITVPLYFVTIRLKSAVEPSPETATLSINSTPSGATVYYKGVNIGTTPLSKEVSPGDGTDVVLKLDGYYDWTPQQSIAFMAGQNYPLNATMEEIPVLVSTLTINSNPTGADVYWLGTKIGTTPLNTVQITPGTGTIELRKYGYQNYYINNETINVSDTVNAGTIPLIAISTSPTLQISSSPSTATVYYKGSNIGTTPLTKEVTVGDSTQLVLKLDGYYDWTPQVSEAYLAGNTYSIDAQFSVLPPPPPTTATLSITSSPSGATAYYKGSNIGVTPIYAVSIPQGTNSDLVLKLSGYSDWTPQQSIAFIAGNSYTVNATMSQTPPPPSPVTTGQLTINSTPLTDIYVGGYKQGNSLTSYTFNAGSYSVTLKASGYNDYSIGVTINAGQTTTVNAILTPVAEYPKTISRGSYSFTANNSTEERNIKDMLGIDPAGQDPDTFLSTKKYNTGNPPTLTSWRDYWNNIWGSRSDIRSWISGRFSYWTPIPIQGGGTEYTNSGSVTHYWKNIYGQPTQVLIWTAGPHDSGQYWTMFDKQSCKNNGWIPSDA